MSKHGRRIAQEVMLLAMAFGRVNYDANRYTWVHIPSFRLPPGWKKATTQILILLPAAYPQVGPDGFYLDQKLRDRWGRAPGHYFEKGEHSKHARLGWAWFCLHQEPSKRGGWEASSNVMEGDNLLKYVELIRAILTPRKR